MRNARTAAGSPEGNLSTISSTKLSTRTGVRFHRSGEPDAKARAIRQDPPAGPVELEPDGRVVGDQQAAVEVDPLRQRRDGGRRGDADRRLLHAAEERPKAEASRPLKHSASRS